mgnify:CR=1 FL=1
MKEVFKRKYRVLYGAAKMRMLRLVRMLLLVIMIIPAMAAGCGKQETEEDKGSLSPQADEDSEWMELTPPELAQETLNARNDPDVQGAQDGQKVLEKVYIEGTGILCGVYRAEEGEYARVIGPELCLYPNGEGSFHVHSASSYIASGTYKADGGKLILTDEFSDKPHDIYTFEIADSKLIFLADESAEVWDYGPGTAEDGMVFAYDEEETQWYMGDEG